MNLTKNSLKELTMKVFDTEEIKFNKRLGLVIPSIYIPSKNLVIEYNTKSDFSIPKNALQKINIDEILTGSVDIVHVPYFVQIDERTFPLIFKTEYIPEIHSEFINHLRFPQGFPLCFLDLPACFCSIGVQRFENILDFYSCIKNEIIDTLDIQTSGRNRLEVYPPGLYEKLH